MEKTNENYIYKFTEQDLSMYNTMLTAALTRVIIDRLVEYGLSLSIIRGEILNEEFARNDLQDKVGREIYDITNGSFSLDLFKYNEKKEEEGE